MVSENTLKRNGKRWTVNECLQLQREYELLQLSVEDIAIRHQRTPNAIMYKLDQEGFADYNLLYSYYTKASVPIQSQLTQKYDEEEDVVSEVSNEDYDEDYEEEEDQDDDDDEDEDEDEDEETAVEVVDSNLRNHVMRLEKQVQALTELLSKQSKSKSLFSMDW
jgi:hypothetical protein